MVNEDVILQRAQDVVNGSKSKQEALIGLTGRESSRLLQYIDNLKALRAGLIYYWTLTKIDEYQELIDNANYRIAEYQQYWKRDIDDIASLQIQYDVARSISIKKAKYEALANWDKQLEKLADTYTDAANEYDEACGNLLKPIDKDKPYGMQYTKADKYLHWKMTGLKKPQRNAQLRYLKAVARHEWKTVIKDESKDVKYWTEERDKLVKESGSLFVSIIYGAIEDVFSRIQLVAGGL